MAELLIKAVPAADPACYQKGDIVEVRNDGAVYGTSECPPLFVVVKIPGITRDSVLDYTSQWDRRLQFDLIASNHATGTYKLKVSADAVGADGQNALTREAVESFLARWGCTVDSVQPNAVTFTAKLWSIVRSSEFWDVDVSGVTFVLVSYNPASGGSVVRVDHSANPAVVAQTIEQAGGTIISNTTGSCTFGIGRSALLEAFKRSVREAVEGIYRRRRYCFSEADVDYALAHGGVLTLTAGQVVGHVIDRMAG